MSTIQANDLGFCSVADLHQLYREKAVTPIEVLDACLDRIEALRARYGLFCFVYPDDAREQALALSRGIPLPETETMPTTASLRGVPYALKDFTPTRGLCTTRGSYAFADWVPDEDPPVVERLRASGGILLGKTATSELAHGSFTRSRLWGVARNPWNPEKTPGGSSGGSAGAVAAGLVTVAEGSDAGGSIRIPASCCGVVGFKPSLGRVPTHFTENDFEDVFHLGPIGRTVDDVVAMFGVVEGPDDRDPLSVTPGLKRPIRPDVPVRGKRIALSVDLGYYQVHPTVATNTRAAAAALERLGADVEEVELGWDRSVNDAWSTNWSVALATLYGEKVDRIGSRADPELVALIARGRATSGIQLKQVDVVRTWQWAQLRQVFDEFDFLLCPTLAVPVPVAEGVEDSDFGATTPSGQFMGLEMTSPFNSVPQCPVISVPSGFDDTGMPTGVQMVGHRFDDVGVLSLARAYEQDRPWSGMRPPCVLP